MEWNSTCHTRMIDATGTIMGLKKNVRNWLLNGIRHSSISASTSASTTASGTDSPEKTAVFLTAIRNAPLFQTLI